MTANSSIDDPGASVSVASSRRSSGAGDQSGLLSPNTCLMSPISENAKMQSRRASLSLQVGPAILSSRIAAAAAAVAADDDANKDGGDDGDDECNSDVSNHSHKPEKRHKKAKGEKQVGYTW